ncbi:HNH endonuclease [Bradyrhizobium sp. cf659]|uniref:HNH endonuclease n=1 Tax=Bradyrhizobium sp. cf659 TaxID=1761771 RepID=UPI0008E53114|nr:HNH endonuclease signature motif containing protein [Bradyrhizobium sp. cf659]SFJ53765.1 putative restriction endonuclease [Bradyrhizobium sp. cf659]
MEPLTVGQEKDRRNQLWTELAEKAEASSAPASVLNELKIFYGGRGIWVDKANTQGIGGSEHGVTVGLLHSGAAYADDLFDDGAIYHYPSTRTAGRDRAEIEATKAAGRLRLPLFFTIVPQRGQSRVVKLAWVEKWDDNLRLFFVSFGDQPEQPQTDGRTDEDDFELTIHRSSEERRVNRPKRAARFKYDVLEYYGQSRCCMCGIRASQLLDAAHIVDVSAGGSDHKRNGLILCASHHRAYDAHLIAIRPDTHEILAATDDLTLEDLGISSDSLAHLPRKPHIKALTWRWDRWQARSKFEVEQIAKDSS